MLDCAICYSEYQSNDCFFRMNCGHEFCFDCTSTLTNNYKTSKYNCPICRQNVELTEENINFINSKVPFNKIKVDEFTNNSRYLNNRSQEQGINIVVFLQMLNIENNYTEIVNPVQYMNTQNNIAILQRNLIRNPNIIDIVLNQFEEEILSYLIQNSSDIQNDILMTHQLLLSRIMSENNN